MLVGGLGGRGVVAGASYEARAYGARSAMPMHQARRLIGVTAVVLPPRGVVYGIASRRVFDTVRGLVPVVEQLSFDEAFAEPPQLAGAVAEDVETFCERLRRRVRDETGLIASVGAGSGKQIAKIASGLAKPDGIRVVRHAEEQALLSGLPVRRLWGIGPVAEEKLHRLGIETIGQLAALSDAEAANILGATIGPALHRLARGIDDRPVVERAEAKQISAESTFAVDLTTMEQLHEAIDSIAEHAHQRLLRDGRGAPHHHGEAKEIRHEHANPLGDDALPDARRRRAVYGGPPAAAGSTANRANSSSGCWVFGFERHSPGVVVCRLGLDAGNGGSALRRNTGSGRAGRARRHDVAGRR